MLQQLFLLHPPDIWLSSPKHVEDGIGSSVVSLISIDNLFPSHRDYVTSLSWFLRFTLDLLQLVSQTAGCSIPPIPIILTYVSCCGLWCCFCILFLNILPHTFLSVKSVRWHSCHLFAQTPYFLLFTPMLLFVTVHHKEFSNHLVGWSFV